MSEKTRRGGRVLKSAICIVQLKDDQFYTPSDVARIGADPKEDPRQYKRFLESLGSFSRNHGFESKKCQKVGKRQAWQGKYWKQFVKHSDIEWATQQLRSANKSPVPQSTKPIHQKMFLSNVAPSVVQTESEQSLFFSIKHFRTMSSYFFAASIVGLLVMFFMVTNSKKTNVLSMAVNTTVTKPLGHNDSIEMSTLALRLGNYQQRLPYSKLPERVDMKKFRKNQIRKTKPSDPVIPPAAFITSMYATMHPGGV